MDLIIGKELDENIFPDTTPSEPWSFRKDMGGHVNKLKDARAKTLPEWWKEYERTVESRK